MSLLEKVLYLADFTSADRDYDDVDVMRSLVDISLQDGMQSVAKMARMKMEKHFIPMAKSGILTLII